MILKLPPEVARFALRQCTFIGIGRRARGMFVRSRHRIIILDENTPLEHLPSIIAHEIAHAFLNHRGRHPANERDAARLAARWGFHGPAADPAGCMDRITRAEVAHFTRSEPTRTSVSGGAIRVDCVRCATPAELIRPLGLRDTVAVRCVGCDLLEWRQLIEVVTCPRCGDGAGTSILQHATPVVREWHIRGWRGLAQWALSGFPGLLQWAGSGFRGAFSARWIGEDALAVKCGTCGARSRLAIAGDCTEGAGMARVAF